MNKGYLFVGGPAHGTFRAVEAPHIPVLVAQVPQARYVEELDPLAPMSLDITTYVRQRVTVRQGRRAYLRNVFAPQGHPMERVDADLKDFLLAEWVTKSPDQVEEVRD